MAEDDTFGLLLQEIMIKTLQPYKCVMIFTDDMYSDLFEMPWFKRFGNVISFII
ncbi:Ionotropic receptor 68a, partial [Diabrotica virgifera virgifera]